jgi:hypothetical protein
MPAHLCLQGLQPIANILSTEAPTEIGGNSGLTAALIPLKKLGKTTNQAGCFLNDALQGLICMGFSEGRTCYPQNHQQGLWVNSSDSDFIEA